MALPWFLDRERGFGLLRELLAERAQLRDAAQHAVDKEAVHHGVEPARELGVVLDELIRHRAAEPVAPALLVETQQVVAIGAGAVDPYLADHAVDQRLGHRVSCCSCWSQEPPHGFRRMPPARRTADSGAQPG